MFLGMYLYIHTYIQYGVYCFIFILRWTFSWVWSERSVTDLLLSPTVSRNIKCRQPPPGSVRSWCGTRGTRHFPDTGFLSAFAEPRFLVRPLLLLGCTRGSEPTAPGKREWVLVVLGNRIWEVCALCSSTSLPRSYTSAPTSPQMTSFHCMKNYSSEVCLSSANQQSWCSILLFLLLSSSTWLIFL